MDGWKTILSFWEGIIFRGSCWTSGLQSFLPKFVQGHEVRQETHHCWAPQQYGGCQFENIAPKPMRVGVQHFPEILAFGTQSKIINGPKDGSNIDARLWELDMVNWNLLLHTYICTCIYNMSYACIPRSSIGRRENEFRNLQRCGTVYFSFTFIFVEPETLALIHLCPNLWSLDVILDDCCWFTRCWSTHKGLKSGFHL